MSANHSIVKIVFTRSAIIVSIQLIALGVYYVGTGMMGVSPKLFEIDISYLFSASWSELRAFFPNYYWAIYLIGRFYQLSVSLFAIYLLLVSRVRLESKLMKNWQMTGIASRFLLLPFLAGLVVSLTLYFSLDLSYGAQLVLSRAFIGWTVIDLLLLIANNREYVKEALRSFMLKPELPYALAITRILFYTYSIFLCLDYVYNFQANIGALDKVALPYLGWFIMAIPISPNIYMVACVIAIISAGFIAVGYKTRFWQIVHSIAIFYVVATPNFFGKLAHHQMFIWISWIMAVSPSADVLSIDSILKPKTAVLKSGKYSFHLKMIWLHFGLIYFFAGFFKLWICGYDWAFTDSMINQIQIEWFEHFDRIPSIRFDHFPLLLKVGGFVAILFELAYVFMLFDKRLRWLSILGGLVMHNIIGKVMYIAFLHLLQAFYIVFIPWNAILKRLKLISVGQLVPVAFSLKSPVYVIPVVILSANMLASVFNINSYPFSVYPVYAEIVPDNVKYFEYRIRDKGLESIDARLEGKEVGFEWERYSRTEYHVIRMWEAGAGLDTNTVKTLWSRWQLSSKTLDRIDSVDVYVVEHPLMPEKATVRISEKYLMSIHQKPKRNGN